MAEKSVSISSRNGRVGFRMLLAAVALIGLTGCELSWTGFQKQLTGAKEILFGAVGATSSKTEPKPEPSGAEFSSPLAQKTKANAELLREILRVVYMREPSNRTEFGSLVDSLNQGASFEGLYNGFTHSSIYRKIETANPGATEQALKVFSEELMILESELPTPTVFDANAAKPLAVPVTPTADSSGVSELVFEKRGAVQPSPKPSDFIEKYSAQFAGASIFTLKRVLGDEALKVVNVKKDEKEKLAAWYSKWVVRMAEKKVDFGLELRNKLDEQFHYKWAMSSSEDQLRWEVLNRLHRVLNHANEHDSE